jgi:RNA polymerase sigma-70 factor (ECF subfamily)
MSRATTLINGETPRRPASAGALYFSMPSPSSRQNSSGQRPGGLASDASDGASAPADEQPIAANLDSLNTSAADDPATGSKNGSDGTEIESVDTESLEDVTSEVEETEDETSETDEVQSGSASTRNGSPSDAARAEFLQVLQRAKEGDRKAFEQIYQMYHRRIYNAVYGMLSDADDAQDVTQDVFIRLHDALPTLRADEAFSTYLYRIALNLCRDRARRKKRVRFQSMDTPRTDSEGEVEPMEFPDLGKLPEETIAGEELQKRVRQAVQNLSDDHKAVIVMHHFQGMEVNDIARILDVPTGTVKSRLARGRDQLHRKLRGYLNV